MANLLPTTERKALAIERRWRLANSIALLFALAGLTGLGLLVPSFIAARSTLSSGAELIETTQKLIARQSDAGALKEIDSVNDSIAALKRAQVESSSGIIAEVLGVLPAGVVLTSINWKQVDNKNTLDIAGSASTRNALIAFGDGLRGTGRFDDVVIPIQTLAAQTDLPFRLSLILN